MLKKIKIPMVLSVALLSISFANISSAEVSPADVSPVNLSSASLGSEKLDKYSQEIQQVMNDDIIDQGYAPLSENEVTQTNDTFGEKIDKKNYNAKLKQRLKELRNAEVVLMSFDKDGNLIQADSNKDKNALTRFHKKETEENTSDEVHTATILTNTSPVPGGALSGAFHRIKTQYSTSQTNSFTGAVADSIVFPTVSVTNELAATLKESSYMYVGFDTATSGYAEVGFGTLKTASAAAAWYPVFHEVNGTLVSGYDSNTGNGYYYDISKPYANGSTVNSFKVYYKYDEQYLKIYYLIGTSQIYVVDYSPAKISSKNISVKRLTTKAINGATSNSVKFVAPWTTYGSWNNFKFLTNNGTQAFSPSQLSLLENASWNHGGTIDYTVNGTTESYKIY